AVGDLRKKIDHLNSASLNLPKITWSTTVPIKVNCFIWRAAQKRIASLKALSFRSIAIPSTQCGACINTEEDADHALVICPFAKEVR
ncbi:hypothetical protein GUG12_03355, partial [Xanthomonas citri pv. citri]|nr:hypothetical protein [Xanthomonas citri pv. citri]